MQFQGTQGEWVYENRNGNYYIQKQNSQTRKEFIGQMLYVGKTTEPLSKEGEYNALLVSKAPEMLEMLKVARDKFLDLKYEHDSSLKDIQWEIEELIKQATEL